MGVKVFNTGKLEIPGIQDDELLTIVLDNLIEILKPHIFDSNLHYLKEKTETVLINSNFNCGYYINREKLFDILKFNYCINSCYDPCSYPGIQCEFYYNKDKLNNDGKQEYKQEKKQDKFENNILKVSFMIFR